MKQWLLRVVWSRTADCSFVPLFPSKSLYVNNLWLRNPLYRAGKQSLDPSGQTPCLVFPLTRLFPQTVGACLLSPAGGCSDLARAGALVPHEAALVYFVVVVVVLTTDDTLCFPRMG